MFAWRCNVCDSRRVHTRCVNTHTWYGQKGDARAYIRVRVLHLRQSWPWMRLATASDYACIVKKTIWFIFHFSFFFFFSFLWSPDRATSFQSGYTYFVTRFLNIMANRYITRIYSSRMLKNKRSIGEKGNVGN